MEKFDIHTHILPKKIPNFAKKFGYGEFIYLENSDCGANMLRPDGSLFRKVQNNCLDAQVRLEECRSSGVTCQVLSTVPVMFNYWAKPKDALETSRFLNDDLADVVSRNPDQFLALGTVPVQDSDLACQEATRCIRELGFRGLQIGSHSNGFNLDDPHFHALFETLQAEDACLFVHPWDMMGKDRFKKYWMPWLVGMPTEITTAICSMIFGGVFDRFPKLRVAFAHGGGSFPFTLGRISHGFEVRPDLVAIQNPKHPREYIGRFYLDTLVHDPKALKLLLDIFGPNCLALGSDYPFPLGESHPGKLIEAMGLPDEIKQRLLYGTAKEWLGIK